MYIGTSLGGCLVSLMHNEVSEDEVMFIVTRTLCPYDLTKVKALATRLYYSGRIHQPRVFDDAGRKAGHSYSYNHPAKLGQGLWMQVVPTNDNSTPAVVEAWEKYKMLDNLTK